MKKNKYENAVMEIVEFDFEDVLDTSDFDNIAISGFKDNDADAIEEDAIEW